MSAVDTITIVIGGIAVLLTMLGMFAGGVWALGKLSTSVQTEVSKLNGNLRTLSESMDRLRTAVEHLDEKHNQTRERLATVESLLRSQRDRHED